MRKARVLPNLVFSLLFWNGISASAEPHSEILIRLQPNQKLGRIMRSSHAEQKISVLNSDEKLFKLSFPSEDELNEAIKKLSAENIPFSRNHYYRPSLLSVPRDVAQKRSLGSSSAHLPFASKVAELFRAFSDLPDILDPHEIDKGPDPLQESDWAYRAIRMPTDAYIAKAMANKKPIVTALIDTGIDYNHEDLNASLWRGPNHEIGWDVIHEHSRPFDVVKYDIEGCLLDNECKSFIQTSKFLINPGHGTHCAGHIGAVANNSRGIRGMAYSAAKIMTLKFIYGSGEGVMGSGDDLTIVQSIDWAIKNGAKILNMSWGGRQARVEAEQSEFKRAMVRARDAGILVIAAAGNDAINLDSNNLPSYPAAFEMDNLIVVAAVDRSGKLADFSNFGPRTVHVAAPGVKILSTIPNNDYASTVARFWDESMGKTREIGWDGTSMAAPLVTGAAALIWAAHPEESYRQIRKRILTNVRPMSELQGKVQSGGILDVGRAMK